MEGDLDAVRPRLLHDTARGEAHPAVETIELRAMVDEAEFHFAKAGRAAVGLHRRHQLRPDSVALLRRLHRNKTKMRAFAADVDEDAWRQHAIHLSQ